jgi:glycosyltransferase involved in cell wall biosynthesis
VVVVFSHDAFFQRYGGVSRCVVELMRHLEGQGLSRGEGVAWRAFADVYGSHFLKELHERYPDHVAGSWSSNAPGRIMAAWRNEDTFARTVATVPDAVVHRTYYPMIDRLPAHVPVVVTLHDMYWEAPGVSRSIRHRLHSWLKRKALIRADRIICISRFTYDELMRVWPDLGTKAEVIHHGVSPLAQLPKAVPVIRRRFVFVGDRSGRKNFDAALSGLAASGLHEYDLLCLGGGAFSADERALIERKGLTGRVVQQAADDAALADGYASGTALLYPSTYEGFGMPLLEAMLHDCPVIAARTSSLPEVGGNAVLYADPHTPADWAAAMAQVTQASVRERMIEHGRRHAGEFRWQDVARRYAEVYRQLRPDWADSGAAS